jgi:hypothetical protein
MRLLDHIDILFVPMQPGGYILLKRLGLAHCVDGIDSQKVHGYCMFKEGKEAKVAYPTEGMGDDVAGRSFHHGRHALLQYSIVLLADHAEAASTLL